VRRPRDGLFSLTRRRENFRPHNERWRYRRRERLLFTGEARKQGDRRLHRLRLDVLLTHTARGLPRRLQARGDLPDLLGGNGHDARRCAARDRGALHRADGHRSARERLRGDGAAQDVEVGDHTRRRAAGLRGLLEVPRTPATAFGVRIWISSPGRIFSRAAARANLPEASSSVERPGTSVTVSTERSRTVTTALPPRSMRARDLSPVVMVSRRNTSSLNFRETGAGRATRRAVTLPSRVVTTPAFSSWAIAMEGVSRAAISSTAR